MNKPFDTKALLVEVAPVIVPLSGALIEWVAKSLEMNANPWIKGVGPLVRGSKETVAAELNKIVAGISSEQSLIQGGAQAPVVG